MIDHRPMKLEKLDWKENAVRFMLRDGYAARRAERPGPYHGEPVRGRMETNALPFHVLKNTSLD